MNQPFSNFLLDKRVIENLKDKTWLGLQLQSGKSVQQILEFSDQTLDQFYTTACQIFETKAYNKAANAFLFLATLNPYHYDYWIGLGASTQWCGDYEAAIDAYEMAAICQIDNPIPYFHLAKCLFAIHDRTSALQALELAIEYSEEYGEYDEIHRQALAAKKIILQEEGSGY